MNGSEFRRGKLHMKAIIVAAGLGSRLGGLASNRPKCSLPVGGLSIFERQLRALRASGITDISAVTGHKKEFFFDYPEIKTYFNADYQNNNILLSLMCARPELNSDVIVCYSDIIYRKAVVGDLLPLTSDFTVVADLKWRESYVGRTSHPESQAEKIITSHLAVAAIGKHLKPEESSAEFIGMFAMSREGCEAWKTVFDEVQLTRARGPFQQARAFRKAYVSDMIQELVDRKFFIKAHLISGGWMEIDTEEDYAAAQKKCLGLE